MKRIVAVSTITGYLAVLLLGLCAHALNYKASSHPGMYFLVWDMFCGWSAYEDRTHVIGQGESGRFYELAPGPWGDYHPFGDPGRQNYDPFANHAVTLALNTLRYSEHEPMQNIYVVQETWAKKFNLPDELWEKQFTEPKDTHSYFHVRRVYKPDGQLVADNPGWFDYQAQLCLQDNPRLQRDSQHGRPFFDAQSRPVAAAEPTSYVFGGLELTR